ncbi:MAG: choice-of-anchor J domain-containing protein [Bacteroidales bacterium]|jgi:hypothetical protein|nr:choice-of-anchor J domain-containing protein [Bacteroidales bacterium]
MKHIVNYIIAGCLLFTASCTKTWNERNLPLSGERSKTTNVIDREIALDNDAYTAIVKLVQADLKKAAGDDTLTLQKLENYLTKAQAFPDFGTATKYIAQYLDGQTETTAAAALFKSVDPGSKLVVTFSLTQSTEMTSFPVSQVDTLQTEDYDAMGTASGQPGRYDNFDNTMGHINYLKTFLKLKYPYAKMGDKRGIVYKFYFGSPNGTLNDATIAFVYNGSEWDVMPEKANFEFTKEGGSRNWNYVNTLILSETLIGNFGTFTPYSLLGDAVWIPDPAYGAKMTEYTGGANHEGDDWLISAGLNLSERQVATLVFDNVSRYLGPDPTFDCGVYVSTTYNGGAPNPDDWTKLDWTATNAGSWDFYTSGRLSLKPYCGESNVYIAFRYRSTETAAGTWEVKNVLIEAVE